jgi:hypothetical protein
MKKKQVRKLSTAVKYGHGLNRARKQAETHTRKFKHKRRWLKVKLQEA